MEGLVGVTLKRRYRVEAFIGRGGMAEVYKIYDQQRMAPLAMKLLHDDLSEDMIFLRRFRREGKILQELQHPNIVRFYGLEEDGDQVFMLMDFVEGITLRKEIKNCAGKPFPTQRVMEIMQPICSALYYAHQNSMIHCDIKPANIMIKTTGQVLLTDFGIARQSEGATTATMVGAGTPAYMAPEQVRGEDPSPQTDIYALGVVLYELLTGGERPFTGDLATITGTTAEKVRWEQVHTRPISPRDYYPSISEAMEAVILKCLAKDPAKRYATTQELYQDLTDAGGDDREKSRQTGDANPQPIRHSFEVEQPPTGEVESHLPVEREKTKELEGSGEEGDVRVIVPLKRPVVIYFLAAAVVMAVFLFILIGSNGIGEVAGLQKGSFFSANFDGITDVYYLNAHYATQRVTKSINSTGAWNPIRAMDGSIYFTCDRFEHKSEVCVMDPKNGIVSRSVRSPGKAESWDAAPTDYSNLFFTSNRYGKVEILLLDEKANVRRVFQPSLTSESWDPAPAPGRRLYFTSNREDSKAEIFLLENGLIKQVTHTSGKYQSWDPTLDSNGRLYFTSDRAGGDVNIYIMEMDGTVRQVTSSPRNTESWNPVIGPGNSIFFTSNRYGKDEIMYMNVEGKVEEVTSVPGNDEDREPDPLSGKSR